MHDADDLLGPDEAADVAGVAPDRIEALVDQGALTPVPGEDGTPRFRRAEVDALRHLGG